MNFGGFNVNKVNDSKIKINDNNNIQQNNNHQKHNNNNNVYCHPVVAAHKYDNVMYLYIVFI